MLRHECFFIGAVAASGPFKPATNYAGDGSTTGSAPYHEPVMRTRHMPVLLR
jgi:hypothetical protein